MFNRNYNLLTWAIVLEDVRCMGARLLGSWSFGDGCASWADGLVDETHLYWRRCCVRGKLMLMMWMRLRLMKCTGVAVFGVVVGSTRHSGGYLRTEFKILTTMDQMHKVVRITMYWKKRDAAERNSTIGSCWRRKVGPKKLMAIVWWNNQQGHQSRLAKLYTEFSSKGQTKH